VQASILLEDNLLTYRESDINKEIKSAIIRVMVANDPASVMISMDRGFCAIEVIAINPINISFFVLTFNLFVLFPELSGLKV
jgi:hypothetical protein